MSSKRKKARCLFRWNERKLEEEQIRQRMQPEAERQKEVKRIKELERLEEIRKHNESIKPLHDWLGYQKD